MKTLLDIIAIISFILLFITPKNIGSTILSTDEFYISAYFILKFKQKNERWLDPVFVLERTIFHE